jgi:hypothetical protein
MIDGIPKAPVHAIPRNVPMMPPSAAITIPVITAMAPAIIQSMPAVVGFQVLSIFCSPFYFLYNDIVRSPYCQYPKTSITTTAVGLPAATTTTLALSAIANRYTPTIQRELTSI